MSDIPFGRAVELVTERLPQHGDFRIGLETITKETGRLNFDLNVEYDGDGIAFQPGDVLFGKLRPNLAKAWLADRQGEAVGDFHVYRPREAMTTSRYLAYLVLSDPFLGPVIASVSGAKMPRADWSEVRNVKVWLPSAQEQEAIADYLDRETAQIDAFIAKNEELIALLTERRFAMVKFAVTNGVGSPTTMVNSGVEWIGEIPAHWEIRPLRWTVNMKTGSTPSGENVFSDEPGAQWIRPDDIDTTGAGSVATRWLTPFGASQGKATKSGDTLLCTIGATIGKVGRVDDDGIFFNQQITSLSWSMDPNFLFWAMVGARDAIKGLSVGNTLPILNNDKLATLRIPVPPMSEQKRIVQRISSQTSRVDNSIETAHHAIELAKERRAALISAAVTGKIDVSKEASAI